MVTVDDKFITIHAVLRDVEPEQGAEIAGAVRQNLAFHDFHHLALLIFKLLCENDNRERLGHQVHEGIVGHVIFSFAQGYHPAVGGLAAV